jgi:predicted transcriptional regulator
MEKKMTKREMFEQIKANYALTESEVKFIDHELELLAKKNSADKKPTKVQVENEGIKDTILDGMEVGKLYTITDLIKSIPEIAELSNQRVSALVRQLVADGSVVRTEEKRKAYFSKVD